MWRVAAMTGMRRGELVGLRWSDVNLDGQRLAVRQIVTELRSANPRRSAANEVLRLTVRLS